MNRLVFLLIICSWYQVAIGLLAVPTITTANLKTGLRVHGSSSDKTFKCCELEKEVESMKNEAKERLQILVDEIPTNFEEPRSEVTEYTESIKDARPVLTAISNAVPSVSLSTKSERPTGVDTLLEETTWKIVLDIGREPGTWMKESWGKSGDRLMLTLEICFTGKQLYEREPFLGSIGGSKECQVIDNLLTISPSLTEGSREVLVRDGGWRIVKGAGPLGTDLLRFYVELEEGARHSGSDVDCPKGKIFCTCGYFPTKTKKESYVEFGHLQKQLKIEQKMISEKYENLLEQMEQEALFSFKKVKLFQQIIQVGLDAQMINAKLNDARIIEPDRDILRFSNNGDVALTREGGVCKRENESVYLILGKFEIASAGSRW